MTAKEKRNSLNKEHREDNTRLADGSICKCGRPTLPSAYFHLVKRIWQCELCMLIDDANDED